VATNTAHATGDGSDHANVALNDTHRGSAGLDHSYLADNLLDVVIAVADASGGATTAALTADLKDLSGAAKSKTGVFKILASDTQYGGRRDPNTNVTFSAATLGSILASGNGWAVIKTDANGQFACTANNAVDETVWFSCVDSDGGVDAVANGVAVRGCVPDDATWSA
jgi:hypothetical protein